MFFHVNADAKGNRWNTRAVIAADGSGADQHFDTEGEMVSPLAKGTRWPENGELTIDGPDGPEVMRLEPLGRFQMRGIGYTHPKWGHGQYQGPLAVEREDFGLLQCDPGSMDNYHVQLPCKVTSDRHGEGIGVFEQLIIGPYKPYNLKEFMDLG